jgi:hypothetical protein
MFISCNNCHLHSTNTIKYSHKNAYSLYVFCVWLNIYQVQKWVSLQSKIYVYTNFTFYITKKISLKPSCEKFKKNYKSILSVRSEKFYFLNFGITSTSSRHFPKFLLRKTADLKMETVKQTVRIY